MASFRGRPLFLACTVVMLAAVANAQNSTSATSTGSATGTSTATSTSTASGSASASASPSATATATATSTSTASSSASASSSSSATATSTATGTSTSSASASASASPSSSPAAAASSSSTPTTSPSPSPSPSPAVVIDGHVLPTWFAVAVAGSLIGFGVFQAFLGYKFFRFTLFFLGFLTAGVTVFLLSWDHINDPNSMWYGVAMGGLAGLLVGLVGALVPRIGVFLVGAALGVVTALILNTTVLYRLYPANPNLTLGIAGAGLGLALGGLATLMMRTVVVISTSVVGAYATVRGIGYFAGNYPADEWALKDQIANGQTLPPEIYGYFAGMLAMAVIGCVVQFCFTAKKAPTGEKDEWEQEFDDSEFSLAAITGKGKKKSKKKKGSKKRKGSKKDKKSKKGKGKKDDVLLDDYDYGDEAYYDDGGAGGYDNYDEQGGDYEEAADGDGFEMPSTTGGSGGGGGGASSRFGGWFGRRGQVQQQPSAIEW